MSLINQMLNQLEQRGAHGAPDQTQIRAVPTRRTYPWLKPVAVGVSLFIVLALLGGWLFAQRDHRTGPAASNITPTLAVQIPPQEEETIRPASRLSLELSVLPMPDALRERETPRGNEIVANRPLVAAIEPEIHPEVRVEAPLRPPVLIRSESVQALKQVSPQQRADAEYRKGVQAQQQGRVPEALTAYETALKANERHEAARLALAALLQENGQPVAAERALQAGLQLKPVKLAFGVALARLQVGRDQLEQAVATLQSNLPQAEDNAEYQAFYAALLQRQQHHKEAINHYQIALRMAPRNGVWLVGYAISLQALARNEDAKTAYRQALATRTLTPELTAFVQQKLAAL